MALIHRTVGVLGDYANWGLAYDALRALGALADDYEFEQISDVTDNAFSGLTYSGNGHSVRFYCSWENSHQGDPTRGFKSYLDGLGGSIRPTLASGVLQERITVENLYCVATSLSAASLIRPSAPNAAITNVFFTIKNNLLMGMATSHGNGIQIAIPQANYYISNCKSWDINRGIDISFTAAAITARDRIVENCTSYNCAIGFATFPNQPYMTQIYRNCYAAGGNTTTLRDWSNGAAASFLYNCADSEGLLLASGHTKSDCLEGLDESVELASLLDTNSEFLALPRGFMSAAPVANPDRGFKPLRVSFRSNANYSYPSGIQLPNSGMVPSLVTEDITGKPYGKWGDYPIGCHVAEIDY